MISFQCGKAQGLLKLLPSQGGREPWRTVGRSLAWEEGKKAGSPASTHILEFTVCFTLMPLLEVIPVVPALERPEQGSCCKVWPPWATR